MRRVSRSRDSLNPALCTVTACIVHAELAFTADDGSCGRFSMERFVRWPGSPQLGHVLCETDGSCLRPGHYEIATINFDLDDDEGSLLRVFFKECDVSKLIRHWNEIAVEGGKPPHVAGPLTQETCIRVIQDYIDAGWKLFCGELNWWPDIGDMEKNGPHSPIYFDEHGNVLQDVDDDEEEDDDE